MSDDLDGRLSLIDSRSFDRGSSWAIVRVQVPIMVNRDEDYKLHSPAKAHGNWSPCVRVCVMMIWPPNDAKSNNALVDGSGKN